MKVQEFHFVVEPPILGFRSSASSRRDGLGRRRGGAFDPRYRGYKERVLAAAMQAGYRPKPIDGKRRKMQLGVHPVWEGAPKLDWKNVYGAVEDALVRRDRYVQPWGAYCGVQWRCGRTFLQVAIAVLEEE